MATTKTTYTKGGAQGWDMEVHYIFWDPNSASVELTTGLSVIYAATGGSILYGTDTGHAIADTGQIEIDETVASDGSITVSSNAITVNRIPVGGASGGDLEGQNTCLILWGKS